MYPHTVVHTLANWELTQKSEGFPGLPCDAMAVWATYWDIVSQKCPNNRRTTPILPKSKQASKQRNKGTCGGL